MQYSAEANRKADCEDENHLSQLDTHIRLLNLNLEVPLLNSSGVLKLFACLKIEVLFKR